MASLNHPNFIPLSSPLSGATMVGVAAASPLTISPGIISLAASSSPANIPAMFPKLEQLSAFARETGLAETFISPVLTGSIPYAAALSAPGFINNIWDVINGITEVNSEEKNMLVPIGEIHCPKIKGCEATYTQETQNEQDNFIEIKIFGIGGGDNASTSVGFGYKVTAKEQCLRFFQEMKLRITRNKHRNGKEFTTVDVVDRTYNHFQKEIDNCPTCKKEYNLVKENNKGFEYHEERHVIADTSITKKIKIDTGTDFNLGIDFPELGIKSELKISTKVIKEITCEYHLVPGYDYIGYAPKSNSSLFCWTWSGQ
jgi:hypothetical protein